MIIQHKNPSATKCLDAGQAIRRKRSLLTPTLPLWPGTPYVSGALLRLFKKNR